MTGSLTAFQHLQLITPVLGVQLHQAPVAEDEHVDLGQSGQQLHVAVVSLGDCQFPQQPGQADVLDGVTFAARLVSQRADQPGFACAGGARDQHVEAFPYPLTACERLDQCLIQAPGILVVDVFQGGAVP